MQVGQCAGERPACGNCVGAAAARPLRCRAGIATRRRATPSCSLRRIAAACPAPSPSPSHQTITAAASWGPGRCPLGSPSRRCRCQVTAAAPCTDSRVGHACRLPSRFSHAVAKTYGLNRAGKERHWVVAPSMGNRQLKSGPWHAGSGNGCDRWPVGLHLLSTCPALMRGAHRCSVSVIQQHMSQHRQLSDRSGGACDPHAAAAPCRRSHIPHPSRSALRIPPIPPPSRPPP